MNHLALEDILSFGLLESYANTDSNIALSVHNPLGVSVIQFGAFKSVIKPEDLFKLESTKSDRILKIQGGACCGIVHGGEWLGYFVLECDYEKDLPKAEFFMDLIRQQIELRFIKENSEFDIRSLEMEIQFLQKINKTLAQTFSIPDAAASFLNECQVLLMSGSGGVYLVKENQPLKLLAKLNEKHLEVEFVAECIRDQESKISKDQKWICCPIADRERILGAVILGECEMGTFDRKYLKMLQAVSAALGSTISNIQAHGRLIMQTRVRSNLERYLSPNLVQEIIQKGETPQLGGKRVNATVLFSDIRGFTTMSETRPAEVIVPQLNEYFEEMTNIIFENGGTLDKFVGDLIMALFGVPKPQEDANVRAIKTGIEMQKKLAQLNQKWKAAGMPEFNAGIGINCGEMVFGNIGSSKAMGLTVIGANVNQAQRIEANAKAGQVVVSERVFKSIDPSAFEFESLGHIQAKGTSFNAYLVKSKKSN